MRITTLGHFAVACFAVLSVPSLASTSLRHGKAAPEALDPEIAEAERLAAEAEAEANGDLAPVAEPVAPVATPVPVKPAAKHKHTVSAPAVPAKKHKHKHTVHRAVAPEPPAPTRHVATKHAAVSAPPAGEVPRVLLPKIIAATPSSSPKSKRTSPTGARRWWRKRARAKAKMKEQEHGGEANLPGRISAHPERTLGHESVNTAVGDHHSTVRAAVRAAVKEVLPSKPSKRKQEAMRRLPEHVARNVGKIAYNSAPGAQPPKRGAPPGITAAGNKETEVTDFDPQDERAIDYSQVEPGLAYGHGQPHTTTEDQRALMEARELEEAEHARQARELEEEISMEKHEPTVGARQRRMLHEVEELEKDIAEETKSKSLAYMLGGVKMDLYQLNEKIDMLQKDVKDGVPMDPAHLDENLVYPLSACMRCIFVLSAQYFILYTAVAVCKGFVDVFDLGDGSTALKALRVASDTMFYAPMLCVLFLGAHLRALQITLGKHGPQEWAETAMQVCAWSCLVQTLMVLAIPFFTTKVSGETQIRSESEGGGFAAFLTFIRYVSLACLYAGLIAVCVAVQVMDARSLGAKPPDIWDDPRTAKTEYAPPVSVAMICTIMLTLFFFAVHLVHAVLWSCKQLVQGSPGLPENGARAIVSSWEECIHSCTSAVNLAPMLCILFIASRMRALQMDPKWGRPQPWAEGCFYACVGSIMAQTFMIIVTKIFRGTPLQTAVLCLSSLVMAVTYIACGAVMVSMFTIQAKDGDTPPVSPAMFCVMFLVVLYLCVYLCIFVVNVANSPLGETGAADETPRLGRVLATLKMSENTVKFGPMLAVLFVAARLRALQMSNQQGSPQCWAQDAMYMASGAVFLQLAMVIATGAMSPAVEVDDSGSLVTKRIGFLPGRIFLEFVKAATFVMLFGGVLTVVASILIIRPETAQCAK